MYSVCEVCERLSVSVSVFEYCRIGNCWTCKIPCENCNSLHIFGGFSLEKTTKELNQSDGNQLLFEWWSSWGRHLKELSYWNLSLPFCSSLSHCTYLFAQNCINISTNRLHFWFVFVCVTVSLLLFALFSNICYFAHHFSLCMKRSSWIWNSMEIQY